MRYVILTPGRAGSFLLVTLLRSHPAIEADFELLRERVARPDLVLRRRAARAAAAGKRAWGFSVHPPHLYVNLIPDHGAWVAGLHDRGMRVVTLVRRNLVAQALSALVAGAQQQWHQRSPEETRPPVAIAPKEVLRNVQAAERDLHDVESLVAERSHLALTYEDHLRDPHVHQDTADRVFRFLDLDPAPVATSLVRRPAGFAEQISNWTEIADVLRLSGLAHHIDDQP